MEVRRLRKGVGHQSEHKDVEVTKGQMRVPQLQNEIGGS
jgi:hypothetical protein